jgi:hypothetical protein
MNVIQRQRLWPNRVVVEELKQRASGARVTVKSVLKTVKRVQDSAKTYP